MLVIVTGSERISGKDELIADILKYNPCVTTIVQNINRKRTSMVLGDRNYILYGKGYLIDDLCGLRFRISPSSFYQVNQRQTEVLYNTAIRLADLKKEDILIDAYCGTGTIGLSASRYVKKVYGVESNRSAIKDANTNKKLNEIENTEFICEDAGKYMEYLSKNKTHIDTVIMDPPRAGADFKFMSSMVRMNPDKIIYISCNPITLKDNLKYLRKYYTVKKIQPVDMFPYTQHIETVVLLSKVEKSTKKIHVDFSLEDLDLSGLKDGATYEEIKAYVKENYGFHVSNLNIAQTKEKYGIKERENYNLAKKNNIKQPRCTEEKEEAILDAFKHFNMV